MNDNDLPTLNGKPIRRRRLDPRRRSIPAGLSLPKWIIEEIVRRAEKEGVTTSYIARELLTEVLADAEPKDD